MKRLRYSFSLCAIFLFLFSSCTRSIIAFHSYFPFICFEKGCRKIQKISNDRAVKVLLKKKNGKAPHRYYSVKKIEPPNLAMGVPESIPPMLVQNIELKNQTKNLYFNFDSGDYRILNKEKVEVKKYIETLNYEKITLISIAGFTDSIGDDEYNIKLSLNRAREVYSFFKQLGFPDSKLSFKGRGESLPVKPNDTFSGRAMNRRVEAVIETE